MTDSKILRRDATRNLKAARAALKAAEAAAKAKAGDGLSFLDALLSGEADAVDLAEAAVKAAEAALADVEAIIAARGKASRRRYMAVMGDYYGHG